MIAGSCTHSAGSSAQRITCQCSGRRVWHPGRVAVTVVSSLVVTDFAVGVEAISIPDRKHGDIIVYP